jgi:tight adherence protein B
LPWLRHEHARLTRELRFLRAPLSATAILSMQAWGAAATFALALVLETPWMLPLLAVVLVTPKAWLARARALRVAAMEEQLDTWLTVLANALQASPALGEAIEHSVHLTPAPLGDEIGLAVKEHQLGTPLDDALAAMTDRIGSRVIASGVMTLRIARKTGGDVGRTLASAAAGLRELARLEGVVRTKTAEGRAQATMIGVLPAPLFVLLDRMDPNFLAPLFTHPRGHAVLVLAGMLWLTALVSARRIVAVDV